MKKSDDFLS